jgi:hypothetical protein
MDEQTKESIATFLRFPLCRTIFRPGTFPTKSLKVNLQTSKYANQVRNRDLISNSADFSASQQGFSGVGGIKMVLKSFGCK